MLGSCRRWATRLSTVVLVLVVGAPSPCAVVWCYGEDGHVRLEAVGVGCCGEATTATSGEVPLPLGEHAIEADGAFGSSCGSCVHVPLRLDSDEAPTVRVPVVASPVAGLISDGLAPLAVPAGGAVCAPVHRSPPARTVLRL